MITEKGELDVGIDFCGKTHTAFEIRPPVVRDTLDALADPKVKDNELYSHLFVLSRMIVKLGDIPKDQITTDLLANLTEHDLMTLVTAKEALEQKLSSFRKPATDQKPI